MRIAALLLLLAPGRAFGDADGDGIPDAADDCPYAADPGQQDSGGVLGPAPDGIGDACQCGDVSGDGLPNVLDVSLLRRALSSLPPALPAPQKCDVAAAAGSCDSSDVARLRGAIAGEAPAIEQICAPASPGAGVCGNGVRDGTEACDGLDLAGDSCQTLGFTGGTLVCDSGCAFDTSACQTGQTQGGFCTDTTQCLSGLSCVDGVCCGSACSGTCQACDLGGSTGICTLIPDGQDPDVECAGVSCDGFYYGFVGSTCYRKADVPATQTSCNGAGACESLSQSCSAQTAQGPATSSCDPTCQATVGGTCTGVTPGQCTNLNPGSVTCGFGVCQQTVNICVNGVPQTCTPDLSQAHAETCNSIDDNCDGSIDNGAFSDAFEPNDSCSAPRTLTPVGSDQTVSYSTMTVYGSGDVDTYRVSATETDNSCPACGIRFNEYYHLQVSLTVPAGAGSYELCVNTGTCSFSNCIAVAAGAMGTLTDHLQGSCLANDSYDVYVRVRGLSAPGFSCLAYTLSYFFGAGYCS
jgi:hypothetical protein